MNLPNNAEFSAEKLKKLSLVERVELEEARVGSLADYIHSLGIYYGAVPEHAANMLQLQRAARVATDQLGDQAALSPAANAFYWGEILGYRVSDALIGDAWGHASYRLINHDLLERVNSFEDQTDDVALRYHMVADEVMGELESMDGTRFPPVMDEYIETRVRAMTDDPRTQHYMSMGFRYVVSLVTKTASSGVAVANTFYEMMDENEMDDGPLPEKVAVDGVRDYLMERFADHITTYGVFDEEDDEAVDAIHDYLGTKLNQDFLKCKELSFEDDVVVSGDALFVSFGAQTGEVKAHLLPPGTSLHGSVSAISMLEVPTNEMIARLRLLQENPEASLEPFRTNIFGVTMVLDKPFIMSDEGVMQEMGSISEVCVVLNNPAVKLFTYR